MTTLTTMKHLSIAMALTASFSAQAMPSSDPNSSAPIVSVSGAHVREAAPATLSKNGVGAVDASIETMAATVRANPKWKVTDITGKGDMLRVHLTSVTSTVSTEISMATEFKTQLSLARGDIIDAEVTQVDNTTLLIFRKNKTPFSFMVSPGVTLKK